LRRGTRRATKGKHRRPGRFRSLRLAATTAAVLVVACPIAGSTQNIVAHADAAPTRPGLPTGRFTWRGIPARETLHNVIERMMRNDPGSGLYTYVRLQRYSLEASYGLPPASIEDVASWRAPDGSGAIARAVVPGDAAESLTNGSPNAPLTAYAPGQLAATLGFPAAKAEILGGQFDYYRRTLGYRLPELVAIMNSQQCLTGQQRAASLQVLADTDGLFYLGRVEDRHGRSGLAFSLSGKDRQGHNVRDILIFDETHGELLSYEQEAAVMPATSPARAPAVLSYVLYLGCGYTDHLGQTP
jgi:hypothetical protein